MNRYGQEITWSTMSAPRPFTGVLTSYTARDAATRQLFDDEPGDNEVVVLHSAKTALNWEARVTKNSTDFLELSTGAKLTVSGFTSGTILASNASERWALGQAKTVSVQATHYPFMVGGDGDAASNGLNAFTPSQTLSIATPGAELIYGTAGLGHAAGVVHGLTLEQALTISEDDPSPDGKLLGAAAHGYLRTAKVELLATGAAPARESILALTGAPSHAGGYKIESVETRGMHKRGTMYAIQAVWIPPFG